MVFGDAVHLAEGVAALALESVDACFLLAEVALVFIFLGGLARNFFFHLAVRGRGGLLQALRRSLRAALLGLRPCSPGVDFFSGVNNLLLVALRTHVEIVFPPIERHALHAQL